MTFSNFVGELKKTSTNGEAKLNAKSSMLKNLEIKYLPNLTLFIEKGRVGYDRAYGGCKRIVTWVRKLMVTLGPRVG